MSKNIAAEVTSLKNITKIDKFIFFAVIFLAIFWQLGGNAILLAADDSVARAVVITLKGKEYARYNLNDIKNEKIVAINSDIGYNVVKLTKNGAQVIHASCADQVDVHQGEITKPHSAIVCLPNQLVITIEGKSEADTIAY
ncbi:MAG: NusG domain II-containing protein [Clostridiales bacterium]|jgi:hypothetical protein|nr:NusG domain II-containing protein [Clostridiales bacterium]